MYKIAGVEPEEREILFQNTAFRKGMLNCRAAN